MEAEAASAPSKQAFASEGVHKAVKEFLHVLEPWSVKLQRRNPEDWNHFCQAIIDNLMEEDDEDDDDGIAHS